jgi:hypothetical protein
MCTLSFRLDEQGYELFFNRDEQRTRKRARPPVHDVETDAVFPVDPDGGGTWIALHRSGMSLCLLNYYPAGEPPYIATRSRGLLVRELLTRGEGAAEHLHHMRLDDYRPFTLCVFEAGLSAVRGAAWAFQWDGARLHTGHLDGARTSSSRRTVAVERVRMALYEKFVVDRSVRELGAFHRSHAPRASAQSVCMHREDAQTVSFTHIVAGSRCEMTYHDGPPCTRPPETRVMLRSAEHGA